VTRSRTESDRSEGLKVIGLKGVVALDCCGRKGSVGSECFMRMSTLTPGPGFLGSLQLYEASGGTAISSHALCITVRQELRAD
jgi:hypothetical protein